MIKKRYKKILIANRGEIASRIIRTAHKMGISCVCIYSNADENSLYIKQADESRYLGPSPSHLSYLNIQKICEIAIETGVEAVHPGYGFLSENPDFPRALKKYNIDYIGPSAEIIEIIANKIIAKKYAKKAGVSVVPGYIGKVNNPTHAVNIAKEIGFPVILKSSSGSAGRGIKIIRSINETESSFISIIKETKKNFNNNIFIEKYIELPRHIEIQILADKYGNIICLGERECSIQRKNQKIIEEAPSTFINDEIREKMYNQCISLAKEVKYFSVGTIEFIVDQNYEFYFIEMNTRLQVEHPVTEFITGIDIVEEMIRTSYGEKLKLNQNDIKFTGYSIESRICAEDPSKEFLPSSGRIKYYHKPNETDFIRIDDGITEGSEVSIFYDSMIAKVITYGKDRIEAINKMQKVLSEFHIIGIQTNIEFLESIFHNPNFIAAKLYTSFIDDHYPNGFHGDLVTEEYIKIFIFSALYIMMENKNKYYYNKKLFNEDFIVKINEKEYPVINAKYQNNMLTTTYNHTIYHINGNWKSSHKMLHIRINDMSISLKVEKQQNNNQYIIKHAGMQAKCYIFKPHIAKLNKLIQNSSNQNIKMDDTYIRSPISGLLIKLYVNVGDNIKIGQPLFIIEAMKMENIICAELEKMIVENIFVKEGTSVHIGDMILSLKAHL